jgi:hypothetical protein
MGNVRLITVARFEDSIQASLAKQLLADFGIESVLAGWNAANVYSGLPAMAAIELQVLESESQQAQQILESHEKQGD